MLRTLWNVHLAIQFPALANIIWVRNRGLKFEIHGFVTRSARLHTAVILIKY